VTVGDGDRSGGAVGALEQAIDGELNPARALASAEPPRVSQPLLRFGDLTRSEEPSAEEREVSRVELVGVTSASQHLERLPVIAAAPQSPGRIDQGLDRVLDDGRQPAEGCSLGATAEGDAATVLHALALAWNASRGPSSPDVPAECCERFGPFHHDPSAWRGASLDLTGTRGRGGHPITVTARALFLGRDLRAQRDVETIWSPKQKAHALPPWDHDTAVGGLGLDANCVDRWRRTGARVLDVGSGLSIVPTELACLGVHVETLDAEFDAEHRAFDLVGRAVREAYVDEMAFLRCCSQHARHPRYVMNDATRALFDACWHAREEIAGRFPAGPARRVLGDACDLAPMTTSSFDVVLSGWLMVHLDETSRAAALVAMTRVTRVGGEIRIKAGHGGDAATDLHLRGVSFGDKRVRIDPDSSRDDLRLIVEAA
jgi:SAM-dependent methyltransferase